MSIRRIIMNKQFRRFIGCLKNLSDKGNEMNVIPVLLKNVS